MKGPQDFGLPLGAALLVVRAEPEAQQTAGAAAAAGWQPQAVPIWRLELPQGPARAVAAEALAAAAEGAGGLVLTSANGVRALAALAPPPLLASLAALPSFAVGPATAAAAQSQLGLSPLVPAPPESTGSPGSEGAALARLLAARLSPSVPLLHPAGSRTAREPSRTLQEAGFELRRAVLYRMDEARALPPPLAAALKADGGVAVALSSRAQAALFARLVLEAGLAGTGTPPAPLALVRSPAVAEPVARLLGWSVRVAEGL